MVAEKVENHQRVLAMEENRGEVEWLLERSMGPGKTFFF